MRRFLNYIGMEDIKQGLIVSFTFTTFLLFFIIYKFQKIMAKEDEVIALIKQLQDATAAIQKKLAAGSDNVSEQTLTDLKAAADGLTALGN